MKTTKIVLFVSAFLASLVEGVEALTVVLATGTTRGWRSILFGAEVWPIWLILAGLFTAPLQADGLNLQQPGRTRPIES